MMVFACETHARTKKECETTSTKALLSVMKPYNSMQIIRKLFSCLHFETTSYLSEGKTSR